MPDTTDDGRYADGTEGITEDEHVPPALKKGKAVLNPVDRVSEIYYGTLMTLTFTCAISLVKHNDHGVKSMLYAAIGANIAAGLIDGVKYIMLSLAQRGHSRMLLDFVHRTKNSNKAKEVLGAALPPLLAKALGDEGLEKLRRTARDISGSEVHPYVTGKDLRGGLAIFILVFLSTFPVTLPFVFVSDEWLALRISNVTALTFMFTSGWFMARYGGYNKLRTCFFVTLVGVVLVVVSILLGNL